MTASATDRHEQEEVCEHERIARIARGGRGRPYLQFDFVGLPAELEVPTCSSCGDVIARSDADAESIDAALDAAYRAKVAERARQGLEAIVGAGVRKRDLERLLGLSPGYLSKVAGSKDPSSALVAALMLVAKAPQARMRELAEGWNPKRVQTATATISNSEVVGGMGKVLRLSSKLPQIEAEQR